MIETRNHGNILEIQLARPPVNALNPALVVSLTEALREAQAQSEAIVLSGLPGIFSAGLDVVELKALDRETMRGFWADFLSLLETIACSPVPVAAAITGHSPAGGAVISLMVDYRVMSRGKYKIGLNETRVGLVIPPLLHNAVARLTGPRAAERLVVGGELIDPEHAFQAGFVDALETGFEETIQNAVQWCEDLLALPRSTMLGNRAFARDQYQQDFARLNEASLEIFLDSWFSDEAQQVMNELIAKLKGKKS
jgi:enoyl-CoA hydratase/carnithine racemase